MAEKQTCLAHGPMCEEIRNIRKLFFWGFSIILGAALAVGTINDAKLDKMYNGLSELKSDVKVIRYRIEND